MTARVCQLEDLERTRDAHVAALNTDEPDAWVACFAPDAAQMPPNEPANAGIDSIRAWSRGMLAAFRAEFSLETDHVELTGDECAFERGTYTIVLTPKAGGGPISDTGKYITCRYPSRWIAPGWMLLAAGVRLEGRGDDELRALVAECDHAQIAAVAFGIGPVFDDLPAPLVDEGEARRYPVLASDPFAYSQSYTRLFDSPMIDFATLR